MPLAAPKLSLPPPGGSRIVKLRHQKVDVFPWCEDNNVIQARRAKTMTYRPSELPDFDNPPVVEALLSVQFDRLPLPKSAHFGVYWERIRPRFPQTEEKGELQTVIERHPDLPQPPVGIQFQAFDAPLQFRDSGLSIRKKPSSSKFNEIGSLRTGAKLERRTGIHATNLFGRGSIKIFQISLRS